MRENSRLNLSEAELQQLRHTLRPVEEAETLPPWAYTSQDFYEAEVREIFMKEWIGVGRADEIPHPGDYLCADIAEEPIVVLRDEAGAVRAFSRACRHRGACVVEGRGNTETFVCPFHGWTYDLRGSLVGAPQMNRTQGFNREDFPLPAIRSEVWEGIIFVNFDLDAAPLAPRLVDLSKIFKNYRLSEMRATQAMSYWNQCNWKLSTEQGIDMYHVPDIHFAPKSRSWMGGTHGYEDPNGHWTTSFTELEMAFPHVTGTNAMASPFPAVPGLTDAELKGFNMFLIYPCTLIDPLPDSSLAVFFYPQGPARTNVVLNLYYPESTFKMPDFEKHVRDAQEGFIVTNNQDMNGARLTHRGMKSRLLNPGRFSYLERTTWELSKYVARRVAGHVL